MWVTRLESSCYTPRRQLVHFRGLHSRPLYNDENTPIYTCARIHEPGSVWGTAPCIRVCCIHCTLDSTVHSIILYTAQEGSSVRLLTRRSNNACCLAALALSDFFFCQRVQYSRDTSLSLCSACIACGGTACLMEFMIISYQSRACFMPAPYV